METLVGVSDEALVSLVQYARSNKHVSSISTNLGGLTIGIRDIEFYSEFLDTTYDLGSYKISFSILSRSLRIESTKYFAHPTYLNREDFSCENLIQHPHVQNGYSCLGNLGTLVAPLIKSEQFSTLLELAISFLQNPDLEDCWGVRALAWPIISGKGIQRYSPDTYPDLSKEFFDSITRCNDPLDDKKSGPVTSFYRVVELGSLPSPE